MRTVTKHTSVLFGILGWTCLTFFETEAQVGMKTWEWTGAGRGSEHPVGIVETEDGGFIVASSINAALEISSTGVRRGNWDFKIVRFLESGETLWTRIVGGPGSDQASGLLQTRQHDLIIAGRTWSREKVDAGEVLGYKITGPAGSSARVVRIDASGEVMSDRLFDSSKVFSSATSVAEGRDGELYVLGNTGSHEVDSQDAWILNLSESGDVRWERTFGTGADDTGVDIIEVVDGIVVVGISAGPWGRDSTWISKLDKGGHPLWERRLKRSRNDLSGDKIKGIVRTRDGGFATIGTASLEMSRAVAWVMRFSATGALLWDRIYDGGGEARGLGIAQTSDRGFVVAGQIRLPESDILAGWLLKIDSKGREVWNRVYHRNETAELIDVVETADGGFAVVGDLEDRLWILKLDERGLLAESRRGTAR